MRVRTTGVEETPAEALDNCIAEIVQGVQIRLGADGEPCHPNMPIEPDAEQWIRDESGPVIEKNWKTYQICHEKVKTSAHAIGEVAHILADLTGSTAIDFETMRDAVRAVKRHCTVGAERMRDPERWIFCPRTQ